jgi:hypothetical protein
VKTFEITFAPTITLAQELNPPYDHWDAGNMNNPYVIVSEHNHSREKTETIEVIAPSKEMAKALFAINVYHRYMGVSIKGGYQPFIIDAVRNIVGIREVSRDE